MLPDQPLAQPYTIHRVGRPVVGAHVAADLFVHLPAEYDGDDGIILILMIRVLVAPPTARDERGRRRCVGFEGW